MPISIPSPAQPPPTDSTPVRIKIDPKNITYIHGIIEAYDDLAVIRTIDNRDGILELLASPSFLEDLYLVLDDLSKKIPLKILSSHATKKIDG